jgi:serine/threonine-protein kinase
VAEQSSADYRGSLGRYALYGEIAAGGMATVHLARLLGPVGFSRTVAIKRLHPHLAKDPEFVTMFLEEARLAARVRHPNVVATLDVVSDDGELFLVMEYVAGESLSRLVRKARERGEFVAPRFVVAIMSGALEGLHSAHEATTEKGLPLGLVHRDVSPQNVHVGVDGVPRLLDFGIAKATNSIQETRTDQIKGKVAYMSPEQLAKGSIDRRADVYAASVVLWETLTGERLFKADDIPSLVYSIMHEEFPPPSSVVPDLPPGLDEIVMKGLARNSEDRWATAREMAAALEEAVAPAPAREIGEWVSWIAGDALEWRQELVQRIESDSSSASSAPPPPHLDSPSSPMEVSSGVVPTEGDAESARARGEAPTLSDEGQELPRLESMRPLTPSIIEELEHHRARAPERGRAGLAAMALGGLIFVAGGVLFGMRWVQTTGDASLDPLPVARPAAAPIEPETAIFLTARRPGPGASASAAVTLGAPGLGIASSVGAPPPAMSGAIPTRPLPPPGASAPPAKPDCENPFSVDARGIRHPKPQCFTKW